MRRCSIVVICVTWQNSFLMSSLTGIGLCKSHFLLKKNEVTKLTAKDKMKKKKKLPHVKRSLFLFSRLLLYKRAVDTFKD